VKSDHSLVCLACLAFSWVCSPHLQTTISDPITIVSDQGARFNRLLIHSFYTIERVDRHSKAKKVNTVNRQRRDFMCVCSIGASQLNRSNSDDWVFKFRRLVYIGTWSGLSLSYPCSTREFKIYCLRPCFLPIILILILTKQSLEGSCLETETPRSSSLWYHTSTACIQGKGITFKPITRLFFFGVLLIHLSPQVSGDPMSWEIQVFFMHTLVLCWCPKLESPQFRRRLYGALHMKDLLNGGLFVEPTLFTPGYLYLYLYRTTCLIPCSISFPLPSFLVRDAMLQSLNKLRKGVSYGLCPGRQEQTWQGCFSIWESQEPAENGGPQRGVDIVDALLEAYKCALS
jgi:hypothetical protein